MTRITKTDKNEEHIFFFNGPCMHKNIEISKFFFFFKSFFKGEDNEKRPWLIEKDYSQQTTNIPKSNSIYNLHIFLMEKDTLSMSYINGSMKFLPKQFHLRYSQ